MCCDRNGDAVGGDDDVNDVEDVNDDDYGNFDGFGNEDDVNDDRDDDVNTIIRVRQIFLIKLVSGQVVFKKHLPSRMSCLSHISSQWLNISG